MRPALLSTAYLPCSLALLLFVSGCEWPLGSGSDYRDVFASVGSVDTPDTVRLGDSFDLIATSAGADGCWRKGRDVVKQAERAATIIPYDQEYTGPAGCTDNQPVFHHLVTLVPRTKGTYLVRVVALRGTVSGKDSFAVIVRNIVVR